MTDERLYSYDHVGIGCSVVKLPSPQVPIRLRVWITLPKSDVRTIENFYSVKDLDTSSLSHILIHCLKDALLLLSASTGSYPVVAHRIRCVIKHLQYEREDHVQHLYHGRPRNSGAQPSPTNMEDLKRMKEAEDRAADQRGNQLSMF